MVYQENQQLDEDDCCEDLSCCDTSLCNADIFCCSGNSVSSNTCANPNNPPNPALSLSDTDNPDDLPAICFPKPVCNNPGPVDCGPEWQYFAFGSLEAGCNCNFKLALNIQQNLIVKGRAREELVLLQKCTEACDELTSPGCTPT